MTHLPAPPVPADADLTDFPFMQLEIGRLRKSKAWLICKRRPELAFYMLNLWTAAWHERPAGSLEDDDDVLADRAMCDPAKWEKVKADVRRGWEKHSDGRLYHKVVTEKVIEAWGQKLAQRSRTLAARIAGIEKRLEKAKDNKTRTELQRQLEKLRHDQSQIATRLAAKPVTPPAAIPVTTPVTATKGEGEGEGEGDSKTPSASPQVSDATVSELPVTDPPPAKRDRGSRLPTDWHLPDDWRDWATNELLSGGAGLQATIPWIDRTAERFRDFWLAKPGKDGIKLDWQATWRNWVRAEIDRGRAPRGNGASAPAANGKPPDDDARQAAAQRYLDDLERWKYDAAHGKPGRPEPKLADYLAPKQAGA